MSDSQAVPAATAAVTGEKRKRVAGLDEEEEEQKEKNPRTDVPAPSSAAVADLSDFKPSEIVHVWLGDCRADVKRSIIADPDQRIKPDIPIMAEEALAESNKLILPPDTCTQQVFYAVFYNLLSEFTPKAALPVDILIPAIHVLNFIGHDKRVTGLLNALSDASGFQKISASERLQLGRRYENKKLQESAMFVWLDDEKSKPNKHEKEVLGEILFNELLDERIRSRKLKDKINSIQVEIRCLKRSCRTRRDGDLCDDDDCSSECSKQSDDQHLDRMNLTTYTPGEFTVPVMGTLSEIEDVVI